MSTLAMFYSEQIKNKENGRQQITLDEVGRLYNLNPSLIDELIDNADWSIQDEGGVRLEIPTDSMPKDVIEQLNSDDEDNTVMTSDLEYITVHISW